MDAEGIALTNRLAPTNERYPRHPGTEPHTAECFAAIVQWAEWRPSCQAVTPRAVEGEALIADSAGRWLSVARRSV
jgi:hypothetical protein